MICIDFIPSIYKTHTKKGVLMKIYFAGSIRGGREDQALYAQIIDLLSEYGTVLTEHIGDHLLGHQGETYPSDQEIYERDMHWLQEADLVVAEVTTPSLGVGYEIGKAEDSKPVLCLYRQEKDKRLSAMLLGNANLSIKTYRDLEEVKKVISDYFKNKFPQLVHNSNAE